MTEPQILCAGAIVHDDAGRLLLIQRGKPPAMGTWSLPGGSVEPGETTQEACVREVQEETGLDVVVGRLVGTVERDAPDGSVFVIADFACRVVSGELRAGTDATDARWVTADELSTMQCAPLLVQTLTEWNALPQSPPHHKG